jgi:peptidoglycan pentaglycine glycine transferase (the first glycine)
MTIHPVTEQNRHTYNTFVIQNNGSFLQSYEWGEWQQQNGREALRYIVKDGNYDDGNNDNNDILLTAQFILHPLPLGQYYLYCPYGPVKNFQFPISNFKSALESLVGKVKANHPKALFVKLESQFTLPLQATNYKLETSHHIQPGKTLLVDLTKSNDEILAAMHPKTRYNIKVAQKHGVIARELPADSNSTEQALALLTTTSNRQGYKNHPTEYYNQIRTFFVPTKNVRIDNAKGPVAQVYAAEYNNRVIASAIMLDFGSSRTYLFGGSSDEHQNVMAPHALHWQAMQDARANGLTKYDFWGIETSKGTTPGFVRFKLGFGGQTAEYPKTLDITWRNFFYSGYLLGRKILS